MAAHKGHKKLGGRQKGVTNKATADARAAIGMFVDNNAHRLQSWLDDVAKGKEKDGKYIIEPNPEKAFVLFQSVIEYHVPKLSRSDNKITGTMTLAQLVESSLEPSK